MIVLAVTLALAQAAAPAPPSPQAVALGERLARTGLLSGVIDVAGRAEAQGVVDAHTELSPAQRARAETVARAALADAAAEVVGAEGRAFATAMTLDQLQSAVVFFEGPAGRAYRAAFPQILASVSQAGPAKDLKGYVTKRLCDEVQVCPPPKP